MKSLFSIKFTVRFMLVLLAYVSAVLGCVKIGIMTHEVTFVIAALLLIVGAPGMIVGWCIGHTCSATALGGALAVGICLGLGLLSIVLMPALTTR